MNDLVQAIENLSADVEKVSRSVDALVQGGPQTEETLWGQAKVRRNDEDEYYR